jgi:hypothetical protein
VLVLGRTTGAATIAAFFATLTLAACGQASPHAPAKARPEADQAAATIRADIERPIYFALPVETCLSTSMMDGSQHFESISLSASADGSDFDFAFAPNSSWIVRNTLGPFFDGGLYQFSHKAYVGNDNCYRGSTTYEGLHLVRVISSGQHITDLGRFTVDALDKVNEFQGNDPRGYATTFRSYNLRFHFRPNVDQHLRIAGSFGSFTCSVVAMLDQATRAWVRSNSTCSWSP